jgi:chromosomal replication initiation ATPase DnaA
MLWECGLLLRNRFPVPGLRRLRNDVHNLKVDRDVSATQLLGGPAAVFAQATQRQLRSAKMVRLQQRVDRALGKLHALTAIQFPNLCVPLGQFRLVAKSQRDVDELIEARDERKLLRFQKQIASYELLIVDELGFVPLSKTGAELLFEMLSQRYERGSTLVTSNLSFAEWTEVLGSERLTGALLDRLTHHVHILEMNGDSFRLKQSKRKRGATNP